MSATGGIAKPVDSEWTEGWRIELACGLASATGIVLLFFSFNLFVLPIAKDLGVTRGTVGSIQALVVAGALGSPVIRHAIKRFSAERNLERVKGLEPSYSAWEAAALPLSYTRIVAPSAGAAFAQGL